MNAIQLVGRLTKDVKVNEKVNYITVAVNRNYKSQNGEYEADFIDLRIFPKSEKHQEFLAENLTKGRLVAIEGHIQSSQYEKDGETVYDTAFIVDNVNPFLTAKK